MLSTIVSIRADSAVPFFAPSHIKICCSSYNVPEASLQTFGQKDVEALRRPDHDCDPSPQARLLTLPRDSLRASAQPPPRGPALYLRGPSGRAPTPPAAAAASCGLRATIRAPAGRPQPEGKGPGAPRFLQTPTWRRPPPPATTTPPCAANGPGTTEEAPESFASPLPASQGPADNQLRLHLPRQPRAAAAKVLLLLVAGARRGLCLLLRPPRVCAANRPTQLARSGRGGRAAGIAARRRLHSPSTRTHRGRLGWPLSCARAGARPLPRQARARGHEHTHTARSPPFPAGSFAVPPILARVTCPKGRCHSGGHAYVGS